jgi:hypothetical protein
MVDGQMVGRPHGGHMFLTRELWNPWFMVKTGDRMGSLGEKYRPSVGKVEK